MNTGTMHATFPTVWFYPYIHDCWVAQTSFIDKDGNGCIIQNIIPSFFNVYTEP